MNLSNITIKEYLSEKGINFRESGKELLTKCLFNDCDRDSKGDEAHLYFSTETGQYDCKKCGEKGNLFTLAKHLGDTGPKTKRTNTFNAELVEKCHLELPLHIREYLHKRGLSDAVINEYKLGYGQFYRKPWITIPIKDIYGNYSFFKLRQDPSFGNDKITYPKGAEAQVYDWENLTKPNLSLVICEGEMDRLLLLSKGVQAITSTHGAMTFKEEWVSKIPKDTKVYVCFDNDDAGKKGSERVAKMVENGGYETHIITLPEEVGEAGDITDYFVKTNGSVDDLFQKYAKPYPERIDTSQFSQMSSDALLDTLGLTIKYDAENKLATFLCELSAYTENAQFNISYNAPSSTGKSYIPTEIARLFPEDDVMEIAYCSPTAFFHDVGQYDKDKNGYLVDLSHKILIFLDQPHNELLARLRPLLSHDKKEIAIKITDKTQKNGTKTKNILLRGYPSVIFCTAGLRIDEQEATRFLLLSPEVNQDKIQQGISATIRKEANSDDFKSWLEENPSRALLKERIRAIKLEKIKEINIASHEMIEERFLKKNKTLKPRHQRDIKRLLSLIKSFAILNVWWRDRNGTTITANEDDINEAFKLWDKIAVSQELNLPPYIYNLYKEVILPAWEAKNSDRSEVFEEITGKLGLSRQEVLDKHFAVYGRMLDSHQLRQQILPMLETAGLIIQEQDPSDKRKIMIFPSSMYQLSPEKRNSEMESGVKNTEEENEDIISEEIDF
ncbi:MAG: toprim domain-containing protein [Candidatus Moranbacteria bacterium]|nr:toprim domain-containing protein [Candidatus Moranbacteria bacterium]